ncbi:hypothetical protein J2S53_003210 [Actinopolyspora lacussalsi]|nr:hypothetical protein [Actinopolyspora lacussalsi]
MAGDGFVVDEDGLRKAVDKLEKIRDKARQLADEAGDMEPGELVAGDQNTEEARELFRKRLTGSDSSLRSAANDIFIKLQERIDVYRAALGEYGRAEDNASVAQRDTERRG